MFNPLLMIDFYKSTHHEQYPVGLTKMVSYYTPRMSRLKDVDKVTLFGLQAFIKEYLIEGFNDNFFNRPEEEVVAEYERVLNATLGPGAFQSEKIRDLHRLGYLPLEISAVPEGTRTAIGVPQIEITNTHPQFCLVGKYYRDSSVCHHVAYTGIRGSWLSVSPDCAEIP